MLPTAPDSAKSADDDRPASPTGGGDAASTRTSRHGVRKLTSSELFGPATELVIVHGQREYRLRVTSNGKLILTA